MGDNFAWGCIRVATVGLAVALAGLIGMILGVGFGETVMAAGGLVSVMALVVALLSVAFGA
jgi:hypothetical protein